MGEIRTILQLAGRRLRTTLFILRLHEIGWVLAGLALLAVLFGKLTPALSLPWLFAGPVLVVAAVAIAWITWLSRRPNDGQVAMAVDERLDLREKLSTALHIAGRDDAFARAAVEDAVAVARDGRTRERVRRLFPVESPRRWWLTPALAGTALIAGWLLPQGDVFARDEGSQTVVRPVSQEVTESLLATIDQIRADEALARELADVMDALDPTALDPEALKSPNGDRREAIKKLTTLKDRLDEIAQGEQSKTVEAMKRALGDLQMPSEDGLAKDLVEAMARGDFEAANEALKQMQEQMLKGDIDPAQAQQIAQQMQQIADQLEQLAEQQKALEEALKQAGMDPNLAQNPQQLQEQIEKNEQLTDQQKQQLQQMAQAQQQACQMCQGMSQAMSQMAKAMGQMGQGGQPGQGQQQMQQAAQQMSQMMSDLEAMQQMMRSAQAMAQQCQGQCQGLGEGLGQNWGQGGAFGGPGIGSGGNAPRSQTPTRTQLERAQGKNDDADVIANLPWQGPIIRGESKEAFKDAAMSAAQSYAENVSDDQIPRKYREAMQHYFGDRMKQYGEGRIDPGSQSGGGSSSSSGGGE